MSEREALIDDMDDEEINRNAIDDEDLISRESWQTICQVRGRNFSQIDAEAWQDLCARRGYVLYRRNPRGY